MFWPVALVAMSTVSVNSSQVNPSLWRVSFSPQSSDQSLWMCAWGVRLKPWLYSVADTDTDNGRIVIPVKPWLYFLQPLGFKWCKFCRHTVSARFLAEVHVPVVFFLLFLLWLRTHPENLHYTHPNCTCIPGGGLEAGFKEVWNGCWTCVSSCSCPQQSSVKLKESYLQDSE